MNVMVTGGAGYIGCHVVLSLLSNGVTPIILDNLSNSDISGIEAIRRLIEGRLIFIEGDVRDASLIKRTIEYYDVKAVIHLAGLKSVGESVEDPLSYYSNNLSGTTALLNAMKETGVRDIVFSSSATVYGIPKYLPIDEQHPVEAINPYGRTKLYAESLLADVANSDPKWGIVCLRYFNPIGSHPNGALGEKPRGRPNNLMPYITQVAAKIYPHLDVYGDDYDTKDGTGIRDYIHVCDLAEGHVQSLKFLRDKRGWHVFNLGTGTGTSVLELLTEFSRVNSIDVPYRFAPRRSGDAPECFADATKANIHLKWGARYNLADMCKSAWRSQKK